MQVKRPERGNQAREAERLATGMRGASSMSSHSHSKSFVLAIRHVRMHTSTGARTKVLVLQILARTAPVWNAWKRNAKRSPGHGVMMVARKQRDAPHGNSVLSSNAKLYPAYPPRNILANIFIYLSWIFIEHWVPFGNTCIFHCVTSTMYACMH